MPLPLLVRGVSLAPYLSFNLGDHVGDDKSAVKNNRTLLSRKIWFTTNTYIF